MTLVVLAGALLLLLGIVLTGYRVFSMASDGDFRAALGVFARATALGLGSYLAGTLAGVLALCSSASASNLCGLGGIVGTGPFAAGALLVAYARGWLARPRE